MNFPNGRRGRRKPRSAGPRASKARRDDAEESLFFHDAAHSLRQAEALTDPPGAPYQAPPAEFDEAEVEETVAYIQDQTQDETDAQVAAQLARASGESGESDAITNASETNGASAETNGASAETNGASAETNGASAETNGATAETNGASAETNGASGVQGTGAVKATSSDNANFSASERLISGSAWSTASVVFSQLVFLVRSIVLARLLSTDAFGLVGMSMTVHGAINALTNFGLSNMVVAQKFEDDDELRAQLNTIWTLDLIRRGLITIVLISLSYPIARFYNDLRLTSILIITCLSLTTEGFNNVGLLLLRREVKWKQANIYEMTSVVLVTGVTILVALWRRDAYALAWGQLAASLCATAHSYFYHPYRPRFQINRNSLRRSSKTGVWFLVIGITVYITTTVDNVFVGKLLGSATLGVYLVAYNISSLPQGIISRVLSSVMFPIVAALNRNEDARLGPIISRVMNISLSLLALLLVPLAVLAPEVISIYGPKWSAAIVPLRILLLTGLFRGLLQNISPIMIGMDRPDLEARSKIAEVVLFVSALWVLVPRYGINGAAWASVLAYFLAVVLRYRFAIGLVPSGFALLPQQMLAMLGAVAGGAGAGFLVLWPLEGAPAIVRLGVGTAAMWGVTAFLLLRLRPELRQELQRFGLKQRLQQLRGRA